MVKVSDHRSRLILIFLFSSKRSQRAYRDLKFLTQSYFEKQTFGSGFLKLATLLWNRLRALSLYSEERLSIAWELEFLPRVAARSTFILVASPRAAGNSSNIKAEAAKCNSFEDLRSGIQASKWGRGIFNALKMLSARLMSSSKSVSFRLFAKPPAPNTKNAHLKMQVLAFLRLI